MKRDLRRGAVAVATTVLASLVFLTTPAAASTHDATIDTGAITAYGTGTSYFTGAIGGTTAAGCAAALAVTADHTAGTVNITTFVSTSHFTLGGVHWVAVATRMASATGTASGGYIGWGWPSPKLTLRVDIYQQTGNDSTRTDCFNDLATPPIGLGPKRCSLRFSDVAFTGAYFGGWGGSMTSSSTYYMSGGGTIGAIVGTCLPPFSSFIGGYVFIDLAGQFTTGTT